MNHSMAFLQGAYAFISNQALADNPYNLKEHNQDWLYWVAGWRQAQELIKRNQ